jgi:hypothetical protein
MHHYRVSAFPTIAFLVCLCAGNLRAQESDRQSSGKLPEKVNEQSDARIKAGYGTADYHISTPLTAFGDKWARVNKDHTLFNRSEGIAALTYEGRVIGFIYNYADSKLLGRCKLETDKGVGPAHRIVDVEAVYGEPSHIGLTPGDASYPTVVELFYEELGIEFKFYNGKLATISAKEPRKDFDYNG